jgi:reactive intermediate/imine deaminase
MDKKVIHTDQAPEAIGPYSQAIKTNETVYLSGQIPLDPATGELVEGAIELQIELVLKNITAVANAAGGDLSNIVKLNVYLTELSNFPVVNELMQKYFDEPYPARAAIGVAALPKGADVEMDAVMVI